MVLCRRAILFAGYCNSRFSLYALCRCQVPFVLIQYEVLIALRRGEVFFALRRASVLLALRRRETARTQAAR